MSWGKVLCTIASAWLSRLSMKRLMGTAFMSGVMCRSASSSPRQWSPQSSLGCSTRRSQSSRSKYCILQPGMPGVQQLREVWRLWHPSEPGRPSGLCSRRGHCESVARDKRRQKREMELMGMLRCLIALASKRVYSRGSILRCSEMVSLAPACLCNQQLDKSVLGLLWTRVLINASTDSHAVQYVSIQP